MRQARLGKLHPATSCSRRTPQTPADFGLGFACICQQHDLQSLSMSSGEISIDAFAQQLALKWCQVNTWRIFIHLVTRLS